MRTAKINQTKQKPLFLPGFEKAAVNIKKLRMVLIDVILLNGCRIEVKSERSEAYNE
ncbi:MAG: hypothetical protein ABIP30_06680 [Ferruginibacter sp.]